jgi:hypothetical protein
MFFEEKLNYGVPHTFHCACWPNLRPFNTHKLQFRSKQCVFLGYSNIHKGFNCLDVAEGRVYISRDVIFNETIFPFAKLNPNTGTRLCSEILLHSDFQPHIVPIHEDELRDEQYANVCVNPVSTNNVGSPMNSAKNCSSFGASIQQKTCSQGASSGHGSNVMIGVDLVCPNILEAGSVQDLNPGADTADMSEPVPRVDSPGSPARARDELPIDHVSPSTGVRGQYASLAVHVLPASPGGGSSVPESSGRSASDLASGMFGALVSSGSAASPASNRPETRLQHGTVRYGMVVETVEPRDLHEALGDENWKLAMDKEFDALQKNQTWHLVP